MTADDKKLDWVKVIALVTAVVSLASAGVSCRKASLELAAKVAAQDVAQQEKARADAAIKEAAELQRQLTAQIDSVRKFMTFYAECLREIRNAQSRLADLRAAPALAEKVPEAERDLIARVNAFVKFVNEWKAVHSQQATLLNGDVARLSLAATQRDFDELERSRQLLEANAQPKLALLEEQLRLLAAPSR